MSRRSRRARQQARILAATARQAQDEYPNNNEATIVFFTPQPAQTEDIVIVPDNRIANGPDPAPETSPMTIAGSPPEAPPPDVAATPPVPTSTFTERVARVLRHARNVCMENCNEPNRHIGRGGTIYEWRFVQDKDPIQPIARIYSVESDGSLVMRSNVLLDPATLAVAEGMKFFRVAGTRADREEAEELLRRRQDETRQAAAPPTPPTPEPTPGPPPSRDDDARAIFRIIDARGLTWTLRTMADACAALVVGYAESWETLQGYAIGNETDRPKPPENETENNDRNLHHG